MKNKISQSEKATYSTIPFIQNSGKGKTMVIIKRSGVYREEWDGVNRQNR